MRPTSKAMFTTRLTRLTVASPGGSRTSSWYNSLAVLSATKRMPVYTAARFAAGATAAPANSAASAT
jgi:hypothetical protein